MTAHNASQSDARAMTIVEVVIAMVLMSMVLGGIMSAVAMSGRVQFRTAEVLQARTLAADLLEHVCALPYSDPVDPAEMGVGADESAANSATFNDIDDFDGWIESPPVRPGGGAPIAGAGAWTRRVTVGWIEPLDPGTASGSESGAKLITVIAERGGIPIASLSRVRTAARDASESP